MATIVDMETLGDRIRALREGSGESQPDLARVSGVKKQAIWKIENGDTRDPSAKTLVPIARHYGVTVDWIVTGDEPKFRQSLLDRQSQAERYEDEMISDTIKIIMEDLERRGDFSPMKDLERFVQYFLDILKIRASWQLKPTPENWVELGRTMERGATLGGRMSSERDARSTNTGISGRNSSKKQRGKT